MLTLPWCQFVRGRTYRHCMKSSWGLAWIASKRVPSMMSKCEQYPTINCRAPGVNGVNGTVLIPLVVSETLVFEQLLPKVALIISDLSLFRKQCPLSSYLDVTYQPGRKAGCATGCTPGRTPGRGRFAYLCVSSFRWLWQSFFSGNTSKTFLLWWFCEQISAFGLSSFMPFFPPASLESSPACAQSFPTQNTHSCTSAVPIQWVFFLYFYFFN